MTRYERNTGVQIMNHAEPRRKAFTLIEVLLVVAILVVLMGVGVVGYSKIKKGADIDTTRLLVGNTAEAVKLYYSSMNTYPTDDEGLQALITKPDDEKLAEKWRGPYLEKGIPVDAWSNELKYERLESTGDDTGPAFRVFSYGPDGQEGTDDDISSVETKTTGG